jgi:hypothetical protein
MFIPDPDFYASRILDPTTATKLFIQKIVSKLSKKWVWDPDKKLFQIQGSR